MEDYISSESDRSKYALAGLDRGYTRNLFDEGNGKSNLVRTRSFRYFNTVSPGLDTWKGQPNS